MFLVGTTMIQYLVSHNADKTHLPSVAAFQLHNKDLGGGVDYTFMSTRQLLCIYHVRTPTLYFVQKGYFLKIASTVSTFRACFRLKFLRGGGVYGLLLSGLTGSLPVLSTTQSWIVLCSLGILYLLNYTPLNW